MFRWIGLILLVAALAAVAGTLAATPGTLILEWGDYRLNTSVAIFVLAVAVLMIAAALLYRFWWSVKRAPRSLMAMSRERRQRRGFEALSRGLVAVAAGDAQAAGKQAKRAEQLLDDRPLTMLLSAQSAQLRGDEQAATKFFSAMRERPETAFLGLRGLLSQAMKRNDWKQGLSLAEEAYRQNPKSEWVVKTLYELKKQGGYWSDAEALLERSTAANVLSPSDTARERAELLYRQSLESTGEEAIRYARKAFDVSPSHVGAAERLARLLIGQGRQRKAVGVIEKAWSAHPDPELAEVYWKASESTDALKKVKTAQKLAQFNPNHAESRIAVAAAALDAQLWGEARSNLESIAGDDASPRVCRLMAALEEAEHGDTAKARLWLLRASREKPEPEPAAAASPDPAGSTTTSGGERTAA
ncbi:MAG: heme biosynthesis protein HemY [Rhodospirillales bacterium]|nr:heme biosynthesis protein HemY [Rhodospirillales bacterium]